jgi:uncharacterized cupredoxin-like copper-binding protein
VKKWIPIAVLTSTLSSSIALAHGPDHGVHSPSVAQQKPWGIAGSARKVSRTVTIDMADTLRFSPDTLVIRQGETIRFLVRNSGKALHEMVIGTAQELAAHARMMEKNPHMAHNEAYMAHVEPGTANELIWTFNRAGQFEFACLVPGHFSAGMKGRITVKAESSGALR